MYDTGTRKHALALVNQGRSLNSVSKETGIARSSISRWLTRVEPLTRTPLCFRCQDIPEPPENTAAYAYLLGLYLGDGYIISKPRQHYLMVTCTVSWPGLIDAAEDAMRKVLPRQEARAPHSPRTLAAGQYPRYFFTNVSDDIRCLYTGTLDKLGIEWTHCTRNGDPYSISVARKASVARLDAHVGPKR